MRPGRARTVCPHPGGVGAGHGTTWPGRSNARARRDAAEAEEQFRAAERQQETARAHEEHATEINPDADPDEADARQGSPTRAN